MTAAIAMATQPPASASTIANRRLSFSREPFRADFIARPAVLRGEETTLISESGAADSIAGVGAGGIGAATGGGGGTRTLTDSSPLGSLASAFGTSIGAWHLGQRSFFPAYLAATLNFAWQAPQRPRISVMPDPPSLSRTLHYRRPVKGRKFHARPNSPLLAPSEGG